MDFESCAQLQVGRREIQNLLSAQEPDVHLVCGPINFQDSVFRQRGVEAAHAAQSPRKGSRLGDCFFGPLRFEPLDGPGGGQRVRLTDPDGNSVEVVHGRSPAAAAAPARALPYNTGSERRRLNQLQRVERGPARVKRLGHCVLRVSDFRKSEAWYKSRFGFLSSDEVYLGEPENVITAFMRCDRGDIPVDHHTFLCIGVGEPGFDHAAFEVEDIDAVMLGNEHLREAGYDHHAGIGRHVLGSQVFD